MGVVVAGIGGPLRLRWWRPASDTAETLALVVHHADVPVLALAPLLAGGRRGAARGPFAEAEDRR
jgi:hypothetical protein